MIPRPPSIHGLIEEQAALRPDAVAVTGDSGAKLTYRDLNARANALARELITRGVSAERCVAIALPRSMDFIIAALAVLKAGGAYVPLDPSYPVQRTEFLLRDSQAPLVISDGVPQGPTEGVEYLSIDGPWNHDASNPSVLLDRRNLAYVIHTSGSTGVPKGVAVSHGDVLSLADDPRLAVAPGESFAHLAPTSFDAAVLEIWVPLTRGGHVLLLCEEQVTIDALVRDLRTHSPDWMWLTAGLFHLLVDYDVEALAAVGVLIAGGDVLSPQHVRAARSVVKRAMYAGYGPTETTVFATMHAVPAIDAAEITPSVPLGSPLRGKRIQILGDGGSEVAPGAQGEIYIAGSGISRGYHGRPALTAERFLPDPSAAVPGARRYRTGDRGSLLPNGEINFHGRLDRQVKIRGFRIELGEIESTLATHDSVAGAAAGVVSSAGGKRLVAYAVRSAAGMDLTAAQLRDWTAQRLPVYMVPANFAIVDELPLDQNGKLDRRALTATWASREAFELPSYEAPRGTVEQRVAEAFVDVLGIDRVSRTDDFFTLGGDSLLALRLLQNLLIQGFAVSPRTFFRSPDVAGIAKTVTDAETTNYDESDNVGVQDKTPVSKSSATGMENEGATDRLEKDEKSEFNVVVNREGQYSIWPIDRQLPPAWSEIGYQATKDKCLAHIETIWTDMRPLSLRGSGSQAEPFRADSATLR